MGRALRENLNELYYGQFENGLFHGLILVFYNKNNCNHYLYQFDHGIPYGEYTLWYGYFPKD